MCVNFMTLALLVPEIQRGGGSEEPPQSQIDQKKPSLNRVKTRLIFPRINGHIEQVQIDAIKFERTEIHFPPNYPFLSKDQGPDSRKSW